MTTVADYLAMTNHQLADRMGGSVADAAALRGMLLTMPADHVITEGGDCSPEWLDLIARASESASQNANARTVYRITSKGGTDFGMWVAETAEDAFAEMVNAGGAGDEATVGTIDDWHVEPLFAVGDRVQAGEPGTEDWDAGVLLDVHAAHGEGLVGWQTGVNTWTALEDLRRA